MKPSMRSSVLVCLAAALFPCASVYADAVTPISLPADFQPHATDFADTQPNGVFMGIAALRARALHPRNGIHGIYILSEPKDALPDKPFMVGDVIYSLNGQPLSGDFLTSFKLAIGRAVRVKGQMTFDRWRQGQTQTVTFRFTGPQPPDLTQGGQPALDQEDWNLGTTGAEGWIWAIPHQTTQGSKQIYITQIEPGSPADGRLNIGDVIIGAFGQSFTTDARKEFGHALAQAETNLQQGKLLLNVWNDGKTREVTIPIKVMGDYSVTAPYTSPKTDKIVDDAVEHLKAKGLGGGISGLVDALGLLATGREDVMPLVREKVQAVAAEYPSDHAWTSGYSLILLTEYYLVTKDREVLPAIRGYATHLARGQSQVGTWGHRICIPYQFSDGTLYGVAPGYGALNQTGLVCMIALSLTQKCGVDNADIRQAIERGRVFFRFFMDKGCIPYGDHAPGIDGHEDNGKVSLAAVMFDLIGDEEAAAFFTKMSIASFNEREGGHTGNYFNFLWGPLGAARGGDEAAAAFMKKLEWFFDLERRRGGNFEYQGKPGMANKKTSEHVYKGWDCTGARLLAYCLPRKKLCVTGRQTTMPAITGLELDDSIRQGDPEKWEYVDLSTAELLSRLESWSPAARERAAAALEAKPDNVVAKLIALLKSDNRYARYGAAQALRYAGRGSQEAADALIAALRESDDESFKFFAMRAFSSYDVEMGLSAHAQRVAPALMQMAYTGHFDDPTGKLQAELAHVMFYSGNAQPFRAIARGGEGIEQIDSEVLIQTVSELLKNKNGGARSATSVVYDKLSEEQLKALWRDIYRATRELAPSGIMFANGVREKGIDLMAAHHTREGMETAVWYLTNQKFHGGPTSSKHVLETLVTTYGGHAKVMLPQLRKAVEYYEPGGIGSPESGKESEIAVMIREAIKTIESAPTPEWELTSIAEYLD